MSKMKRNNTYNSQYATPLGAAVNKYRIARMNLLLAALFTLVNVVLLALGEFSYFLFSAAVPYMLVSEGMYYCGMLPEEIYGENYASLEFFDKSLFWIMLIIALVIIAFYVLCYLFSNKNRVGWIVTALVLFIIDTAVMFWYYDVTSSIIDVIFHVYVIVCFCLGISAHAQMKKLAEAEGDVVITAPEAESNTENTEEGESDGTHKATRLPDSVAIRPCDTAAKARVFIEADVYGHKVIYRRVKRTNELVIDGDVYGEYTALFEKVHMLTAIIDGHTLAVGYDGAASSYLSVDGNVAATKIRII